MTFEQVRPRRRDVIQLDWPGGEGTFGLLLLRCDEIQDAHFEAVKLFQNRGQPTDGVSFGEFTREKELQEVHRMLLQPEMEDPKKRLFKTVSEARTALDINEVAWVQNQHTIATAQALLERGLVENLEEMEDEDEEEDE